MFQKCFSHTFEMQDHYCVQHVFQTVTISTARCETWGEKEEVIMDVHAGIPFLP